MTALERLRAFEEEVCVGSSSYWMRMSMWWFFLVGAHLVRIGVGILKAL